MRLASYFSPKAPMYFAYMFQQVEYQPRPFVAWLLRVPNLSRIMHRKTLVWTRKTQALVAASYVTSIAFVLLVASIASQGTWSWLVLLVFTPLVAAAAMWGAIMAGQIITSSTHGQEISSSEKLFADHPGVKIAIAGSYGKTTIKELLLTILSEGKHVVATPGNKNVSISHARWARKLTGEEDVLLIEYGEGAPGDIARFAKITKPSIGIIAGLAPNHLDQYKTLEAVAEDLFSLADYLDGKNLYVNKECAPMLPYIKDGYFAYDSAHIRDWNIDDVVVDLTGMSLTMKHGEHSLKLRTGLVGRHLLGPLGLAVVLADSLGLSEEQIVSGVAKTQPFEHRMQPRQLGGAWIIDDTYNGNLEGIRAGLQLLGELSAKRKIYVTPGLVDQGTETGRVHTEIGQLIAKANPDQVVLMKNSVTDYIAHELNEQSFTGEVIIQEDPLGFYNNLEHFVAGGDVVLMQNDWTDNYA